MITFSVDGVPVGQGVLRRNAYGATYETSKGHKPWRQAVIAEAREAWAGAEPWHDVAVSVTVVFTFLHLRKHYRSNGELRADAPLYKTSPPDTDHLQRSIGDALKLAGCLRDDAQIAHWDAIKVYGARAGALITIKALEGEE